MVEKVKFTIINGRIHFSYIERFIPGINRFDIPTLYKKDHPDIIKTIEKGGKEFTNMVDIALAKQCYERNGGEYSEDSDSEKDKKPPKDNSCLENTVDNSYIERELDEDEYQTLTGEDLKNLEPETPNEEVESIDSVIDKKDIPLEEKQKIYSALELANSHGIIDSRYYHHRMPSLSPHIKNGKITGEYKEDVLRTWKEYIALNFSKNTLILLSISKALGEKIEISDKEVVKQIECWDCKPDKEKNIDGEIGKLKSQYPIIAGLLDKALIRLNFPYEVLDALGERLDEVLGEGIGEDAISKISDVLFDYQITFYGMGLIQK